MIPLEGERYKGPTPRLELDANHERALAPRIVVANGPLLDGQVFSVELQDLTPHAQTGGGRKPAAHGSG